MKNKKQVLRLGRATQLTMGQNGVWDENRRPTKPWQKINFYTTKEDQ